MVVTKTENGRDVSYLYGVVSGSSIGCGYEIFQAFLETLIGLLDGLKVSCQETKAQDDRDILIRFDKT